METVLALDLGLTWCKAVALDRQGRAAASARAYSAAPPCGVAESTAVIAAQWDAAVSALRDLAAALPAGASPAALAVSAAAQTVLLDGAGVPFTVPAAGARARETDRLPGWGAGGILAYGYAGHLAARLVWLRAREPASWERVARAGCLHSYLMLRLAGRWCTDPASGPGRSPWPAAVRAFGRELPEVVAPEAVAGRLLPEVAAATGLPSGLPVVVGGHDGACANLGAGACRPGSCCLTLSTNWVPRPVVAAPVAGAFGYPVGRAGWAWVRGVAGAGRQIDLAVAALDGGGPEVAGARHAALAAAVPSAPWPDLPCLPPAEAERQAGRVAAALAAGFPAGAIYGAAVRGAAEALAARLGEARAEGCHPRAFVATGGFTRSPFVLEVVSRTLGVPLPVAPDEAAARGAAACAAVATGWFADAEAAVEGGW